MSLNSTFMRIMTTLGGNTCYKLECPKCGHNKEIMIGGSHTSDLKGYFSTELVYCPTCKEPLVKHSVYYKNKEDGENKTENKICPKCGRKTVTYNLWHKTKLKCPECGYHNIKITNLHKFWMT